MPARAEAETTLNSVSSLGASRRSRRSDCEATSWTLRPVTTLPHIAIEKHSYETFYRQAHSGMISGDRGERTTVTLQIVPTVSFFDHHRRTELVIHQRTYCCDSGGKWRVGDGLSG